MSLSYKFLSAAILLGLASSASAAAPAERALGLIQANPQAFKASAYDRFTVRSTNNHADGSTVRLERTYRGLPVLEGDMVMVLDRTGNPRSTNMTLRAPLSLGTRPSVSSDDAIVAAGAAAGGSFDRMPTAQLIVSNHGSAPTLAWKVRIETDTTDVTYYVGAGPRNGGKVLFSTDNHQTAAANATFKTMYSATSRA
jgi:Zn-dependent metalloprotease